MIRNRHLHRVRALLALGLFLFGSNFCLVSAFATPSATRAGVQCHDDGTGVTPRHAGGCCSGRAHQHGAPSRMTGSPCCMSLATASAPELAKNPASLATSFVLPIAVPAPPVVAPAAWCAFDQEHRAGPVSSPAGAPLAPRAPPLL